MSARRILIGPRNRSSVATQHAARAPSRSQRRSLAIHRGMLIPSASSCMVRRNTAKPTPSRHNPCSRISANASSDRPSATSVRNSMRAALLSPSGGGDEPASTPASAQAHQPSTRSDRCGLLGSRPASYALHAARTSSAAAAPAARVSQASCSSLSGGFSSAPRARAASTRPTRASWVAASQRSQPGGSDEARSDSASYSTSTVPADRAAGALGIRAILSATIVRARRWWTRARATRRDN